MADIPSKFEIGVTTGPIRGSRKVHLEAGGNPDVRVAMREIDLEGGEPPLRVYDTSGPYTDPQAVIDINAGLAPLRRQWQLARGDVEEYAPRETKPEDNGQLGPGPLGRRPPVPDRAAPAVARQAWARTCRRCTMPAAASSRPRWNMSPIARISGARRRSKPRPRIRAARASALRSRAT